MTKFIISALLLICSAAFAGGQTPDSQRSESIVTIDSESYYVHTVTQGETAYSLSKLYEVSVEDITRNNPQAADGLKAGQVLKIPVVRKPEPAASARRINRLFDTHTVNQGETLYSISQSYGITVATLLEDNEGLDPAALSVGQKINIRKKSRGEATAEQITEELAGYRDAVNSVSDGDKYHLVEKGETLYSLSKKYDVPSEDIVRLNNLTGGLRTGALIKIPVPEPEPDLPETLPGDARYDETDQEESQRIVNENVRINTVSAGQILDVALLLPLTDEDGKGNRHFLEFYQGALLGLEDIKEAGMSVRVSLYNTSRSKSAIREIVRDPEFRSTGMIIGPVYEDELGPVLDYAEDMSIPVITPLAVINSDKSPVLYQMAPSPQAKASKYRELLSGDKNIILVTTQYKDNDFENEVLPLLPQGYSMVEYSGRASNAALERVIDRQKENLFIISCTHEQTVDLILAKLSSVQNNLNARIGGVSVRIVGSPHWARFNTNIDRNLYFKLGLSYVTSYHADRSNPTVKQFDNCYIRTYTSVPTPYSYRGYDAVRLFIPAAYSPGINFTTNVNSIEQPILATSYFFESNYIDKTNVNTRWSIVSYNTDYSIEVK